VCALLSVLCEIRSCAAASFTAAPRSYIGPCATHRSRAIVRCSVFRASRAVSVGCPVVKTPVRDGHGSAALTRATTQHCVSCRRFELASAQQTYGRCHATCDASLTSCCDREACTHDVGRGFWLRCSVVITSDATAFPMRGQARQGLAPF